MPFDPFYRISEDSYFFTGKLPFGVGRRQHEEAVRQWCLHELLRNYGFRIGDLEIETPVRVGSKTYRIDILVRREGKAWAVIETKEQRTKDLTNAVAQAVSYASAQNIGAEFAAATNGNFSVIQRRLNDSWMPVPDLPARTLTGDAGRLQWLLQGWELISPLVARLDTDLEGRDAKHFLSALQQFFNGDNVFTQNLDDDLRLALDVLLRCVWAEDDQHYRYEKLSACFRKLELYCQARGSHLQFELDGNPDHIDLDLRRLHVGVLAAFPGSDGAISADLLLLRLSAAIAEYGSKRTGEVRYPRLTPQFHHALRDILNLSLASSVNAKLPPAVDTPALRDIQHCCDRAWKDFVRNDGEDGDSSRP